MYSSSAAIPLDAAFDIADRELQVMQPADCPDRPVVLHDDPAVHGGGGVLADEGLVDR